MSTGLVDWSKPHYEAALKKVPPRFRDLAIAHTEEVAKEVRSRQANRPFVDQIVNTAAITTLTALGYVRWYLLYKPERAEAAERAFKEGGADALTSFTHNLHLEERGLLVSGKGASRPGEVDGRLSKLHEKHAFTIVAVTEGSSAEAVRLWARKNGVHAMVYSTDGFSGLPPEQARNQYYYLLDMLTPKAVSVLSNDPLALTLERCASIKGITDIDLPASFTQKQQPVTRPAPAPSHSTGSASAPQRPEPGPVAQAERKRFEFSSLLGAKRDTPEP